MSDLALRLIRENIEKHERGEDATSLDLGNCSLIELPDTISTMFWLEALNLSGNDYLEDLAPLEALKQLQVLFLFRTLISDLAPLQGLNQLQRISASYTEISDLSPLKALAQLQEIDISNTQIRNLAPLKDLIHLRLLYASSTQVSDLSPLKNLTQLQQLSFSNTQISDLAPLKDLNQLQQLSISNTRVSDLSPILTLIKKDLQVKWSKKIWEGNGIYTENCPLIVPPPEVAQQGNPAILRYFDELDKQETLRLYEAKCLIIGEGGAGKTSLVRKLLDRDNQLPEEKETTKGIEVQPLDFILPDGSDFRLHLWDFGGQEIYHATHQFFLTKRSLYVLVDDTRKDEKTVNDPVFSYWFQVVELFGGGSPLLIIQNEKGDRSKQLDLRGMQGRFDFIKESRAANLLTCRGLDEVRRAIEYHISRLPHVGEVLPKQWALIRRALEDLRWGSESEPGRDHISLEEYYALCRRHDIPERERALFLSDYLHDLGAILHFKDNPLLRKIIILNNQWATDAVYKVLDNEPVKKQFGLFTRRDLASIWSDERYQDQQDELLALMEKFEICYQLSDEGEDNWLAPQLLPVEQPDALHWDNTDNLQLRYEYDFMPRGMLSRFIVRMHRYVKNTDLAWRSGVVLERQGALALVTETWGSREIVVRARGVYAKELVTLIAEDFDRMHQRFENLRFKQLIPCNCPACSAAVKPYFYPYSQLLKMKESRVQEVQCGENFVMVNVVGLLDGVFADLKEGLNRAEVRAWVAAGKTRESLERIADFFEETPMLQAQLANAEKEFRLGKITQEEMMVVSQRVSSTILKWLEN